MKKFNSHDLILIPLIVSIIFILGYVVLPFMNLMPLPAFRAIVVAPIYGGGISLLLSKVKKIGVVTFVGFLIGSLLSNFFIWMFIISLLGGVFTDLIILLVFRGYKHKQSIHVSSGLFPAFQLPLSFIAAAYAIGGPSVDLISKPLVILIPTLITFILGYSASIALHKILKMRNLLS